MEYKEKSNSAEADFFPKPRDSSFEMTVLFYFHFEKH
jgi:hypothetical protein